MDSEISLIITIVAKGWGDTVLEASIKAGATGGTVFLGRGVGIHEKQKILGICIEPEKEIVLSVTHTSISESIMQAIARACNLEKPGTGIAFIVPVDRVVGASYMRSKSNEGKDG